MSEVKGIAGGMQLGLPTIQFIDPATGAVLKEFQPIMGEPPRDLPPPVLPSEE
jgi:hypothetical protein